VDDMFCVHIVYGCFGIFKCLNDLLNACGCFITIYFCYVNVYISPS
jgi:hypothetical protein